jgi:hypothetical protein
MSVTHLVFMFHLIFFIRILMNWKHVFHIVPFRPTRVVLTGFRCLEVSNRERNWNNCKNNIYVMSKIQLCQFELPISINILMCQFSLITSVPFAFCKSNRVASWNEGKTIILVRSSIQIPKQKYLFHIQD